MLDLQRRQRAALVAAEADEADDGADVGAPACQRARLRPGVEIFALDADVVAIAGPASAPRHRREESDLAGAFERRVGFHMGAVERGADRFRVLERVRVALVAARQATR